MPNDFLGGGLFFAVAAILWLLYLMPNWAKRREYLDTERNALRLQQTLRVLAETSEVPQEVSVAMNARGVHQQQKMLSEQEKVRRAQLRAQKLSHSRKVRAQLKEVAAMSSLQQQRIRRSRLISTGLFLMSLVAIIGSSIAMVSGAANLGWLLGASIVIAVGAVVMLSLLAQVSRTIRSEHKNFVADRPKTVSAAPREQELVLPLAPVASQAERSWQPTQLPKPLYLSRAELAPQAARNAVNLQQAARKQAALLAETERSIERVRQVEASLPSVQEQAEQRPTQDVSATAGNRFSRMGVVDQSQISRPDFDAAMRRRRAAG